MTTDISHQAVTRRFVTVCNTLIADGSVKSRYAFCKAIGMARQNFTPIQNGRNNVSMDSVCSLIRTYNANPTWLFTGTGDMFMS